MRAFPASGSFSAQICNGIDKFFRILPSKTRICDGFSVNVSSAADFLITRLQITFNHDALDQSEDILGILTVVHDLPHNTDLLLVLFVGVGVVCVNDNRRGFFRFVS